MPIDLGTETVVATKTDRTWRVELFLDEDGSEQLRFHREVRAKNEAGEVVSRDRSSIPTVNRTLDQVRTKTYTKAGITATGLQIMQLVDQMSDVERQYDIDNPPTAPGPPA